MNQDKNDQQGFVHIGGIISELMKTCRPESKDDFKVIYDQWFGVVGEPICNHAHPTAIKGKILLVHVNNSALLHNLHFLKKEIISKLNTAIGNELISEVKFKIGS
jgi:predicted nucleic acid-binding Zn ribbon protein